MFYYKQPRELRFSSGICRHERASSGEFINAEAAHFGSPHYFLILPNFGIIFEGSFTKRGLHERACIEYR